MKKILIPIVIKFGLIGTVMNIIALIVLFYIGKHPLLLNPFLDARWPLYGLFIFFSMQVFRDENNGILHFWQGLVLGISVYLIMAFGGSLFIYIFSEIDSSHFLSEFIRIKSEQLIANKEMYVNSEFIGEDAYKEALLSLPNSQSFDLAKNYFKQSIFIALLPTILLPILMRRNQNSQ